MKTYLVVWEIELEAETPEDAARKAREIQLDPDSAATFFSVDGEEVELERPDDE